MSECRKMGWSEQLREGKKEKHGEIEGYASVIEEENRMRGGESCVHRRQRGWIGKGDMYGRRVKFLLVGKNKL
jgi:hypothetical protein